MLIYMHVTYFVNYIHFTPISLYEACRLGLNINYWLIKNYIRKTQIYARVKEVT